MNEPMAPSPNCVALAKQFEGCRLEQYLCPAGKVTIGYGHTGFDVTEGMVIDQAKAEEFLMEDLADAAKYVNRLVIPQLNQNQFDACVDFVFNCGAGNFEKSTLLKKLNAQDWAGASLEFGRWIKSLGKELPGLIKRRAAEVELFNKE